MALTTPMLTTMPPTVFICCAEAGKAKTAASVAAANRVRIFMIRLLLLPVEHGHIAPD
jgi:hypothetical protein